MAVDQRGDGIVVSAADEQGVAIGHGTRDVAPADPAARAGDVFDDDALTEGLTKTVVAMRATVSVGPPGG